jgi:predicted nucleotidyltransferase
MLNINLKPEYLAVTRKILDTYVPEAEVWVYGSRINEDSHEASDIDMVVRNPNNLTLPQKNINELKAAFTESDLPILVDILDWAQLSESFHERIIKHYVVAKEPSGYYIL